MKVLFVCTGNTCRSPMAEGFMRYFNERYSLKLETGSRGIMARAGAKPADYAVEAMANNDVNIRNHTAKGLKQHEIDDDTVLLTMTNNHKLYIKQNYITNDDQLFTLAEYAGASKDVEDPFGMPQSVYNECAAMIKSYVDVVAKTFKYN